MFTKNVKIMLLLLVLFIAFTQIACDDVEQTGNDVADAIDEAADNAGIPNCLSGAIAEKVLNNNSQ